MINCCFWNLNKRPLGKLVGKLVRSANVGIVCLAEVENPDAIVREIRNVTGVTFIMPETNTPRLAVLARNPDWGLAEIYGDVSGRLSIRVLRIDDVDLLLAVAHVPSKVNWDSHEQAAFIQILADQIRDEEDRRGHKRTILCGDLNMNPFEFGVVSATGLHAMSAKSIVSQKSRTVQGRNFPFFYNPMWGFLGDRTPGPPGTHYFRHTGPLSYDWQLFDQVMFRAEALDWFADHVEIVTKVEETSLATNSGRPDNSFGSDHFPILFRLSN